MSRNKTNLIYVDCSKKFSQEVAAANQSGFYRLIKERVSRLACSPEERRRINQLIRENRIPEVEKAIEHFEALANRHPQLYNRLPQSVQQVVSAPSGFRSVPYGTSQHSSVQPSQVQPVDFRPQEQWSQSTGQAAATSTQAQPSNFRPSWNQASNQATRIEPTGQPTFAQPQFDFDRLQSIQLSRGQKRRRQKAAAKLNQPANFNSKEFSSHLCQTLVGALVQAGVVQVQQTIGRGRRQPPRPQVSYIPPAYALGPGGAEWNNHTVDNPPTRSLIELNESEVGPNFDHRQAVRAQFTSQPQFNRPAESVLAGGSRRLYN